MSKLFGLELEQFLTRDDAQPVLVPAGLPKDGCGWLVEFRGAPRASMYEAVGSLLADKARVEATLPSMAPGLTLSRLPFLVVPREVKLAARRAAGKGRDETRSLYGLSPWTANTAGVHISFTDQREIASDLCKQCAKPAYVRKVNEFWDFVPLFRALDKQYKSAIRLAKRRPGAYEVKSDGRIEYRSLPNTVDLWEVAAFVDGFLRGVPATDLTGAPVEDTYEGDGD